ncbi:glycosyltransferase family 4 protein [Sphingobacterium prati]|uniref:glycosyltransferase family 4 protein n=1 Tax=Sphingobacterium prati TaxID=2737006 RepID=UPI001551C62B|nr:glycosyltransferase family 4 protein [Sphingobacterium prati]NPE45875.1 glycosyltransferase family 4 protein [Sphingobacterium prati]
MKALFIHDHPFIKDEKNGTIYTSGNLNSILWERYLKHFDSITVIGRCKLESDISRYHPAEKENVTFKLFDNVAGGADYFRKRRQIETRLIEEIKKHEIIIMRFPATISVFAAEYCIKNGIKYVAEVVGCSWDANWNYGGLAPKLLAPYSYFKMKKAVKHASASIYVTKEFLQKRYPTRASIIENASNVIIKDIQEQALPNRLLRIDNFKTNAINVGIIGNIAVRYKGYDVLLKAISNLPDNIKNSVKIQFVGGGDPSYLKSLIERYQVTKHVTIRGKLKAGKEIFDFIDNLDIYIHPSKQEGLPRVVIEAMSRACPVLASSVAGTPELLAAEFLHAPGDDKKLTNDIIKVVKDLPLKKQMALDNFERSKEYLFEVLEARRERFFRKVKSTF